ncbi:response regulator transcription factor [Campylobacter sp. RM12327]|uniref:response regulator n=1 Tax=Campylobacter sputorum TaxID=206 RepID=UPI00053BF8FA|nr:MULTISPECIES: response regulator [Campylobacter]ASM40748.1 two-component system response regulator [Campylobacter sputorum]MBE7357947.1 response regulator transcription factor [Campylobacter sp. RM11302]MBF6669651.1 response regulator transcription factor [Campylobacter sp. RM12327]MBF6674877.1 response regulator transcription factor [Campylobacter sp. RM13538]MBF6676510.1 response regulator transcription factor [Campylobacter sp. RM12321]
MSRFDVLQNKSILLVEDDDISLLGLKNALLPYVKQLITAKDGLNGLEEFKKNDIDIIITDINMPNLNGFEMMEEIINIKPDQTFFVITSYDTDENLFKSMKNGATYFLKKPIVVDELLNVLIINLLKNKEKKIQISKHIFVKEEGQSVFIDDELVFLSLNEHRLLWLFIYNIDKTVSYDMINEYVYFGKDTQKSSIHNAITRLKKSLGDIDIINIPSTGYTLKKYKE